jgi:hypothetical protein
LEVTGVWPVSCSSTFDARVKRSPDSPTEMSTVERKNQSPDKVLRFLETH